MRPIEVTPVGVVRSPLANPDDAARQADEGAPGCRIEFTGEGVPAAADLRPGDRIIVLTWLDRADRSRTQVHPRGDLTRPPTGVFSTRSSHRPNPVGLHEVRVSAAGSGWIEVDALEAIDGTPVLDVKPVLGPINER